jgi:catechol 2,3-dioxygenase-like lactoylglutathione lyase family enzyme
MKRFHVHVSVSDLAQSIRFYSTLFGAEPAVVKHDYAKWMLEDPRVNFAISQRGGTPGVNHLGLQTDSDDELESLHARLQQAELAASAEKGVACCYARSDKYWVTDPTGIAWETFHTLGSVPTFDGGERAADAAPCCAPPARASAQIPVKAAGGCCG